MLGDVLLPTSILDFKPKLENRCKLFQVYALQRALILDLRGSIGESLMFYRRNAPGDAVILDFRLRLGNHCKIIPKNTLQRAVILDLRGLIWESLQGGVLVIGSACSTIAAAAKNGPPVALSSLRQRRMVSPAALSSLLQRRMVPPAAPSLLHGRTARLQSDRGGRRRGQVATKAA